MWAAGVVGQEHVQFSAAKLEAGSYAVWMGRCALVVQMRAAGWAGPGFVCGNCALAVVVPLTHE